MGPWRSVEELEDHVVLDELMLLTKRLTKSKNAHYRFLAAIQGADLGEDDDDSEVSEGADDLPEEVLAHERAWKEKKKAMQESGEATEMTFDALGLGYSKQ